MFSVCRLKPTTTKKVVNFLGEDKCTPREKSARLEENHGYAYEKRAPALRWDTPPRVVDPALRIRRGSWLQWRVTSGCNVLVIVMCGSVHSVTETHQCHRDTPSCAISVDRTNASISPTHYPPAACRSLAVTINHFLLSLSICWR